MKISHIIQQTNSLYLNRNSLPANNDTIHSKSIDCIIVLPKTSLKLHARVHITTCNIHYEVTRSTPWKYELVNSILQNTQKKKKNKNFKILSF